MSSALRQIRVFISSTFRDMQEERDHLVKFVFPHLRKLCESRNVTWSEVDLRWGITDEETAEGNVLPICLEEIKRCRPYFIGLLGERYGSMPGNISNELLGKEQWLKDEININKSITELEILQGVFNNQEMANHAYFYFRDPDYIESLPSQKRSDYSSENAESAEKLKVLKQRIRDANNKGLCKLRDGYRNPEILGRAIRRDFTCLINKLFPAEEVFDPLYQDWVDHNAFAASRAIIYIGHKEYFDRLNEYVNGSGQPLIVTGEAGSGKSALLANWYLKYLNNKEKANTASGEGSKPGNTPFFLLAHFIGSTPYSSDWTLMLKRILGELKRHFNITENIPDKPDELRSAFSQWLYIAAGKGKAVIILDSLNQLEDKEGAADLVWIPSVIPENIRLVVSTLSGRQLEILKERGWPNLKIEPLKEEERQQFMAEYFKLSGKSLNTVQSDRIMKAPQTSNPLYLRTLLEELRIYGDHYTLDQYINHYLTAGTITELYEKILERYEMDYDRNYPGLVSNTMSALWAARRGLSEKELLEILGSNEQPLPSAYWSPLFLAAEQALSNHSGLIGFFHHNFRQAIQSRYLKTEQQQKAFHLRLGDYFKKRSFSNRKLDEQPWQYFHSGQSNNLRDTLSDLSMFFAAWKDINTRYEWMSYWTSIADKHDPAKSYHVAIDEYVRSGGEDVELGTIHKNIGWLLHDMGMFNDSLDFKKEAMRIYERFLPPDHIDIATCLNDIAEFHRQLKHYHVARKYYARSFEIIQKYVDTHASLFASAINNIASLNMDEGDYVTALDQFRQALKIWEATLPQGHPQRIIGKINLSDALRLANESNEALQLVQKAVSEAESFLGQNHYYSGKALQVLGVNYRGQGDEENAEVCFRRSLVIMENVFGAHHHQVAVALYHLASLADSQRRFKEAQELYQRAAKILEKVYGNNHVALAECLEGLAVSFQQQNRFKEALQLFNRVLEVRELAISPPKFEIAITLNRLCELESKLGNYDKALEYIQKALSLLNAIHHKDYFLAVTLNNMGEVYRHCGRYDEAKNYHEKALDLREQLSEDDAAIANSLNNLGVTYYEMGEDGKANTLLERALELKRKYYGADHPLVADTLNNLGQVFLAQGDFSNALAYHKEAESIREKCFGTDHPAVAESFNNHGLVYSKLGEYKKALEYHERALGIKEKIFGKNHIMLAGSLNNIAAICYHTGKCAEAIKLFSRSLEISEFFLGSTHPQTEGIRKNLVFVKEQCHELG